LRLKYPDSHFDSPGCAKTLAIFQGPHPFQFESVLGIPDGCELSRTPSFLRKSCCQDGAHLFFSREVRLTFSTDCRIPLSVLWVVCFVFFDVSRLHLFGSRVQAGKRATCSFAAFAPVCFVNSSTPRVRALITCLVLQFFPKGFQRHSALFGFKGVTFLPISPLVSKRIAEATPSKCLVNRFPPLLFF